MLVFRYALITLNVYDFHKFKKYILGQVNKKLVGTGVFLMTIALFLVSYFKKHKKVTLKH